MIDRELTKEELDRLAKYFELLMKIDQRNKREVREAQIRIANQQADNKKGLL